MGTGTEAPPNGETGQNLVSKSSHERKESNYQDAATLPG